MRLQRFTFTPQLVLDWQTATVDYLKSLYGGLPLDGLEHSLMERDVLTPTFRHKGAFLLEPHMKVNHAYYLKKGLAKLFCVDPKTHEQKIHYIWEENSIVVLLKAFREQQQNKDFYIELIEDSELVGISNFSMENIYQEHTVAYELTQKIQNMKTERHVLQVDILLIIDKKIRYPALKASFPGLFADGKCRLSNEDICAFINISETTLFESRRLYGE